MTSLVGQAHGLSANNDLEDLEIQLLLEGVYRHSGYDFRDYARASRKRRIHEAMRAEKAATVSGLQERVLHDAECMQRVVRALTVNVTGMFRDPEFFLALRSQVLPVMRTYPLIRVWCAGCSSGSEAYSLAILLEEEELYDRCRIYATDADQEVLREAKQGICPLALMPDYAAKYQKAGGRRSLTDYYTAAYDHTIFRPALKRNILFAQHNLATDASFNEFHLILCRNVMIYFNRLLQERVHNLIYDSLVPLGFLCLGLRESIRFTSHEKDYQELAGKEKIYRRVR